MLKDVTCAAVSIYLLIYLLLAASEIQGSFQMLRQIETGWIQTKMEKKEKKILMISESQNHSAH